MSPQRPVLAYHDEDFLASDEARPLRIMAEYLQPPRAQLLRNRATRTSRKAGESRYG
jgi:hypothetical protein